MFDIWVVQGAEHLTVLKIQSCPAKSNKKFRNTYLPLVFDLLLRYLVCSQRRIKMSSWSATVGHQLLLLLLIDTILLHREIARLPDWCGLERWDSVGDLLPSRRLQELGSFTLGLAGIEWYQLVLMLRRRAVGNHVRLVIGHSWIIWHGHWSMMVEQVGSCRVHWLLVEDVRCGA